MLSILRLISLSWVCAFEVFSAPFSWADSSCAYRLQPGFTNVQTIDQQLSRHRREVATGLVGPITSEILVFSGVNAKDVYNPTKQFLLDGRWILAARVESRDSEIDSQVIFFSEHMGVWSPVPGIRRFNLQDPFFSVIHGQFVFGGVETFNLHGKRRYRTVFYSGPDANHLREFARGPIGMKDIRLAEMPNGQILVMTRPQGKIPGTNINAGPGKIGFTFISNLLDLRSEAIILNAKLLENQFAPGEWGGVNEIKMLSPDTVEILGHIARFDSMGNREYFAMSFTLNLTTGVWSPFRIILERSDLVGGAHGVAKRPDLIRVIFSGGRHGDYFWVGTGDAQVQRVWAPRSFNY